MSKKTNEIEKTGFLIKNIKRIAKYHNHLIMGKHRLYFVFKRKHTYILAADSDMDEFRLICIIPEGEEENTKAYRFMED